MALPEIDAEIRHKKSLLEQHRRNLMYLEKQAIQYGIDLPLAVHNALTNERETVATLERELSQLGVSPVRAATWQAVVIDPDDHWREIVVNQIAHLGGQAITFSTIPQDLPGALAAYRLGIVGIPGRPSKAAESSALTTEFLISLCRTLPLVLLADWENRDTAIVLRQAARDYNIPMAPVTIFKENFDRSWFSRIVHQILTR